MIHLTEYIIWLNILKWTDWILDQYQSSKGNQLYYLNLYHRTLMLFGKVGSRHFLPGKNHFLSQKNIGNDINLIW